MATASSARRRESRTGRGRRWVRKNIVIDQVKLDNARRALGTATETDTVDRALDLIAFRRELSRGIAAIGKGPRFEDVFEDR